MATGNGKEGLFGNRTGKEGPGKTIGEVSRE
jgi:hypothetical protein